MVYTPKPKISQTTILFVGFSTYFIATLWPPLILILSIPLSFFIPYAHKVNETGLSRRKLWSDFETTADSDIKKLLTPRPWTNLEERYVVNSRGMCQLISIMTPKDTATRGVVCYLHGYGDNASFLKRFEFQRFVKEGFAVVTIEHEGHGRSDGLAGHLPNLAAAIKDTGTILKDITEQRFKELPKFLIGESMGGAFCYKIYEMNPSFWSGVVFLAPMCAIKESSMPPKIIMSLIRKTVHTFGPNSYITSLPIIPSKDISHLSYKRPERRELVSVVPSRFVFKPRLITAQQLLDLTADIGKSLEYFDAPFLVIHGKNDEVTCPSISQMLFDKSSSKDKEIKLYDGMMHSLTAGELDENIDKVFNDTIDWVKKRTQS
mmetsp:Transcript_17662/g.24914  ORF Transcript_17662/g.24914 Transcript_17662/m.24914 type:complete len:376 (+) Transcript_17662:92-1219(+)